jgi:hypothetical protein
VFYPIIVLNSIDQVLENKRYIEGVFLIFEKMILLQIFFQMIKIRIFEIGCEVLMLYELSKASSFLSNRLDLYGFIE